LFLSPGRRTLAPGVVGADEILEGDSAMLLLDRESELGAIETWLSDARDGRGRIAVVLAGAGLGKTELLARAVARAESHGMRTLVARGGELERQMAFGVVRGLFETSVRALSPLERNEVLSGVAAHARVLLGLTGEAGAGDPLGAIHALYWLLANLSEREPVLLAIDDLHWADLETVRWLSYLSGRISDLPVLVIAAARPLEPGAEPLVSALAHGERAVRLTLEPLGVGAVSELIGAQFKRQGDAGFVSACHRATGGNPFYVRELLRAALADGIEPVEAAAGEVPQLGPREVARAILVRVGRLGDSASRLAASVAVLGSDTEIRHAAALSEISVDQALGVWDRLARAEILRPTQPLEFIHPIARTAVYRELGAGERSQAHRRAAAMLTSDGADPQRIGAHASACEPSGDPDVVGWLRSAAKHAAESGAPGGAARHLERALQEPPSPEARAEVHFELGEALIAIDSGRAARSFERSATPAADRGLRMRAHRWCGVALAYAGSSKLAVIAFDNAIALAPDPETAVHLGSTRDFFASWWGDVPDRAGFRRQVQERAADIRGATPGEKRALAVAALSICHTASAPAARARKLADRANQGNLTMAPNVEDGDETAAAVGVVGIVCDDPRRSIFESSPFETASTGSILFAARMHRSCAIVGLRRGELLNAEANARASWEILAQRHDASPLLYWWSAGALVEVLIARGLIEEAATVVGSTGLGAEPLDQVIFPWPPVLRGALALAQGSTEAGIAILLQAGAWLEQRGFTNPAYIPWRALVAPALAATGCVEEAQAVIAPAIERARAFGAPWALGMALRAAGTLEQESDGIELLREAIVVLEPSPCRLEHAHALLALGATLRRANQRVEARDPLRNALDMAHRCGATQIAKSAEQELLATGARPRRFMLSGTESLTASERRIGELAAGGMSNPEIAQSLFISRKTVESHLGHVYLKLDISSRQQLPAALSAGARSDVAGASPRRVT
jgi:DNA-binding CsgD family transcriptional regulator